MTMNSQKQRGSVHIIIAVIVVVVILGVLGFVFWQNFINKDTAESITDQDQSSTQSTEISDGPIKESEDLNEDYLVLKDWGVKFKMPEDSGEIRYYKETYSNENGSFDYYSLTTKRIEELGGRCAPDAEDGQILLSSISRTKTKAEGPLASSVAANNNEPINGYYYYVAGGQSTCSVDHGDWQGADNLMTFNMLQSPIGLE